jgi:thiol-disulfide isomerase/thioredoxin
MKPLILVLMMMTSIGASAQKFQVFTDTENGSQVLKGQITMNDLEIQESSKWFKTNAAYTPNGDMITLLKDQLPKYDMVVVMGTWCEDSQNLIPKLYTVLQQSGYPMVKLTMFGVDRSKDALNGEKAKYGIEKVPTIILYSEGKEIGRITETVQESIEADLAKLVRR